MAAIKNPLTGEGGRVGLVKVILGPDQSTLPHIRNTPIRLNKPEGFANNDGAEGTHGREVDN
jgi:hypothetical protein